MLPWHAITFLKGLGMLTPNPWENGWPRLLRSWKWQKNTHSNHSMAPKEPCGESKWVDVNPLLKYFSGAVGAVLGEFFLIWCSRAEKCLRNYKSRGQGLFYSTRQVQGKPVSRKMFSATNWLAQQNWVSGSK